MSILASKDLAANTITEIFRVDKTRSSLAINFCNRSNVDQQIRLWITPIDVIRTDAHAWVYDRTVPANTPYSFPLNGVVLELGEIIFAYASRNDMSINVAD